MKYNISYIKKQKQYNFTITFKSLEHKIKKLAQYKEGSVNFKVKKLLDTAPSARYIPYNENNKYIKVNKQKTYIKV